jgi:adenylate kinase family enzyme
VIGTSGSGKTTLAQQLAAKLGIPYICNDELFWLPGWQKRPDFAELALAATAADSWTYDGNLGPRYPDPQVLARANVIVWLDYPRHVVFHRLLRRTIIRVATKQALFSGNVERFGISFASRESILVWAMQAYTPLRKRYEEVFERLKESDVVLIRHRSPLETQRWLATVKAERPASAPRGRSGRGSIVVSSPPGASAGSV